MLIFSEINFLLENFNGYNWLEIAQTTEANQIKSFYLHSNQNTCMEQYSLVFGKTVRDNLQFFVSVFFL